MNGIAVSRIGTIFLAFNLFAAGCATSRGAGLIPKARFNYNAEIIRSHNEQMLLNLARLRYNDVPLFLDLNGVVTQYSIGNSASLSTSLKLTNEADSKASADTTPSFSTGLSFNENPTMTYSPLQGEEFAKRILTPISPQTLVLLTQSGWSVSRLFMIAVQRFNGVENATTASGPTPELEPQFQKFHAMMDSLRFLQQTGVLRADVRKEGDKQSVWIIFDEAHAQETGATTQLQTIYEALNLAAEQKEFLVVSGVTKKASDQISLNTRSLLGVLFFLSHAIEPPQAHLEEGLLTLTKTREGGPFDWHSILGKVLRIQTSKKSPEKAYVKAYYRDHWYFIADQDINSKATFNLLHYLFALQSAEGSGKSPLLSLNLT